MNAPVVDFQAAATIASPEGLPDLEEKLKAAELGLTKSRTESARLNAVRWALNAQIKDLNTKLKATRTRAFEEMAFERQANAQPLFTEAATLKVQRDDLVAAYSFTSSFAYENAAIAELQAEIDERECSARFLEGQALDLRGRALKAAGAAAQIDPGLTMGLKDSKSQRLLEDAQRISREVESLRTQLAAKRVQVAQEQELAAPAIFNP